ncbi:MAG: ATP-dependent helicase [Clostridia bacterium]
MEERKLNAAQQEAAMHFTGPALTLAGPGSGKTTVLTERTLNLVRRTRTPEQILSVTFTNAAGDEMRKRYRKASGACIEELQTEAEPVFQTVHSYCNGLIREYERNSAVRYERIDEKTGGKMEILRKLYAEINGEEADPYLLNRIGNSRSGSPDPEIKNWRKIRKCYDAYKRQRRLIDFDDMIDLASEILHSDSCDKKRIREQNQERFRFLQVDEAQDLTKEQFDILQIIAASRNIFVVADDDQSIYGFRGASPVCVRVFYQSHPDCKLYRLSRNYRSAHKLVRVSAAFISKNSDRFDKTLYSEKEEEGTLRIKACGNSILQASFLRKEIRDLRRKEDGLTVGILYRNNISGLLPRALFTKENMPYTLMGEKTEIDSLPFLDGILSAIRMRERESRWILPPPAETLRRLLEEGLEHRFESYCRDTRQHMRYKDAVLSFVFYLCDVCGSWKEAVRLLDRLDAAANNTNEGSICFTTVHSAKGLEYDAVFIIDAILGEFPGCGAAEGKLLEEERRLFYVAMTRARKYLYITYPLRRGNLYADRRPEKESIFLSEIKACMQAAAEEALT